MPNGLYCLDDPRIQCRKLYPVLDLVLLNHSDVSFLGAFAKLRKATISFLMSVRPYETRLTQDGFSWHLIFEDFSKICPENRSFIKIRQYLRVLYMKSDTHFGKHVLKKL